MTCPAYLGQLVALPDTGHPLRTFQAGLPWSGSWIPSRAVAVLFPDHLIHQREGPVIENISYFQVFPDMRTIPSLGFFVNLFSSRRGMWNQNQLRLRYANQAVCIYKTQKVYLNPLLWFIFHQRLKSRGNAAMGQAPGSAGLGPGVLASPRGLRLFTCGMA